MSTASLNTTSSKGTVIVVAGPSGCGKSEVGKVLATSIQATFLDADDYHTAEAKALMHAGHPLSDAERHPWLARVRERVREAAVSASANSIVILACSALKPELRDDLRQGAANWKFVGLDVPHDVLRRRVTQRKGHFFPATLLETQLADWHPPGPDEGIVVNGDQPVEAVAAEIRGRLQLGPIE